MFLSMVIASSMEKQVMITAYLESGNLRRAKKAQELLLAIFDEFCREATKTEFL